MQINTFMFMTVLELFKKVSLPKFDSPDKSLFCLRLATKTSFYFYEHIK